MNILVIDDDDGYRPFIKRFLESCSIAAHAVATGDEALALTINHRPDLILLDQCLASGLSAKETIKRLKRQEMTKGVPVVMISGLRESPEDDLQARRDGAALFVTKGEISDAIKSRDFLRRLLSLIMEQRQAPLGAAPALARVLPPARMSADQRVDGILACGRVRLDANKRRVWVGKREIAHVGLKQFELLLLLMKNADGVSRKQLHSSICEGENRRGVDMAVCRLRKVLGFTKRKGIVTIPQGYKLVG